MAFDAVAPAPILPVPRPRRKRRRDDVSPLNRTALIVGYGAFGAGVGAAVALMFYQASPLIVSAFAGSALAAAVVLAVVCAARRPWHGMALLLIAVAAAIAPSAGVFLFPQPIAVQYAPVAIVAALLVASLAFGRRFVAAFSIAMVGLLLAAPVSRRDLDFWPLGLSCRSKAARAAGRFIQRFGLAP
jgi:ABC-type Fe3+-siderophore transport system permease subunit